MAGCRVTVPVNLGDPLTINSSATQLNCLLIVSSAADTAKITAATAFNLTTRQVTPLAVAADGLSFKIPVDTPGTYDVNVTLNRQIGPLEIVVEDCDAHTQLVTIASKTANFSLEVN
jgi:hypothetical protein